MMGAGSRGSRGTTASPSSHARRSSATNLGPPGRASATSSCTAGKLPAKLTAMPTFEYDDLYSPITWRSAGEFRDILYDISADGIAKITINRPEVRNAFRPQTL